MLNILNSSDSREYKNSSNRHINSLFSFKQREKNVVHTCNVGTFPEVEMGHQLAVEDDHVEAGVVQGGALGHVQVDQGQLGLLPHDVDGGHHRAACNDRYSVFGL